MHKYRMKPNLLSWAVDKMHSLFNSITGREDIRVLFILKHREVMYDNECEAEGQYSGGLLHSGLFNSANFMDKMLKRHGFTSKLVHVVDNNSIDKEVNLFKPDVVIIEAYWVVPEKFDVLHKLHPKVKWVVRNHSKIPFLANEGIAFDWTMKYSDKKNVFISSNSAETNNEIIALLQAKHGWSKEEATARCPYLPNYYPIEFDSLDHDNRNTHDDVINISCFGAIRPLKNHMIQAIAAIMFADQIGKKLRFHINGNRIEGNGSNILKNLRALFAHLPHDLVEHSWIPHDEFLQLAARMDIGMQASYTETYNIVAADQVSVGVPVIVSKEINWVDPQFMVDPNSSDEMVTVLRRIYAKQKTHDSFQILQKTVGNMIKHNNEALEQWIKELHRLKH